MSDHSNPKAVRGQKATGYLHQQTILTLESVIKSISDGSVETTDTSFCDTLPEQEYLPGKGNEE